MTRIFVSHSSRDKQTITNILKRLPKYIGIWIDQDMFIAGEKITEKIEEGIKSSHMFFLFISPEAIESSWVKKEIEIAKIREKEQPFQLPFLFPVIMGDVPKDQYSNLIDDKDEIVRLKLHGYDDSSIKKLGNDIRETIEEWMARYIELIGDQVDPFDHEIIPPRGKLGIKIRNSREGNLWNKLEDICVNAVIAGGITSMTYFKGARRSSKIIRDSKNPSEDADLRATISIIRAFDSQITRYLPELKCGLFYLGEETVYEEEEIINNLGETMGGDILPTDEFFKRTRNSIRVIIDAIDGTSNFTRGVPFFCSSIAVFVEDQLRVSAIYDPLHHQVYSGLLAGSYEYPEDNKKADLWDITTGQNVDMIESFKTFSMKEAKQSMAIHIPRTDEEKREKFVGARESGKVLLHELAEKLDTVYALNSGLLALAQIANCAIDSFVNITTNPWDVAAGEVLIKACGGQITDFKGNPVDYSNPDKVSVVAANSESLHEDLLEIIRHIDDEIKT